MFLQGSGSNGETRKVSATISPAQTHTRTRIRTHAHTHTHARAHTHTCGFVSHSDNASRRLLCLSGCSIIYLLPFPIHLGLRMPFIIPEKPCVRQNLKTWWISKLVPPHCHTLPVLFFHRNKDKRAGIAVLPAWVDSAQNQTIRAFASLEKWKIKKQLPDLQKTFFDSQSLLTAFRIFLQVIKVIKLHDKTNSEMVVNRSLVRLHRLSPYPLLTYYLFCSLAQPAFSLSRRLRLLPTTSKQFLLFGQPALPKRSCRSNELESAKYWSAVSYSITPPGWPPLPGAAGGGYQGWWVWVRLPAGRDGDLPAVSRSFPTIIEQDCFFFFNWVYPIKKKQESVVMSFP